VVGYAARMLPEAVPGIDRLDPGGHGEATELLELLRDNIASWEGEV